MTRPYINPAHPDDKVTPFSELKNSYCLQCKKSFEPLTYVMWTCLSTGKVIWWHINKSASMRLSPCDYFEPPTQDDIAQAKAREERAVYKKFEKIRHLQEINKRAYEKRKTKGI